MVMVSKEVCGRQNVPNDGVCGRSVNGFSKRGFSQMVENANSEILTSIPLDSFAHLILKASLSHPRQPA